MLRGRERGRDPTCRWRRRAASRRPPARRSARRRRRTAAPRPSRSPAAPGRRAYSPRPVAAWDGIVRLGKHRPHRLDQAEPDDRPRPLPAGGASPAAAKHSLHRRADIVLAVDQRAVAIEDGEAVHCCDLPHRCAPARRWHQGSPARPPRPQSASASACLCSGRACGCRAAPRSFSSKPTIAFSIASNRPGLILARVQGGLGASRASCAALRSSSRPASSSSSEPPQRAFGLDREIVPGRHLVGRAVPVGADIGVGPRQESRARRAVERRRRRGCRAQTWKRSAVRRRSTTTGAWTTNGPSDARSCRRRCSRDEGEHRVAVRPVEGAVGMHQPPPPVAALARRSLRRRLGGGGALALRLPSGVSRRFDLVERQVAERRVEAEAAMLAAKCSGSSAVTSIGRRRDGR